LVGGESAGAGGVHRMPERLSRRSNTGGAIGGKMAESALGCQGFELNRPWPLLFRNALAA
jgi:hypothetical protein